MSLVTAQYLGVAAVNCMSWEIRIALQTLKTPATPITGNSQYGFSLLEAMWVISWSQCLLFIIPHLYLLPSVLCHAVSARFWALLNTLRGIIEVFFPVCVRAPGSVLACVCMHMYVCIKLSAFGELPKKCTTEPQCQPCQHTLQSTEQMPLFWMSKKNNFKLKFF